MSCFQGVCTEAGMYALRERRVHVTQEDFELAVAKVSEIQILSKSSGCSDVHVLWFCSFSCSASYSTPRRLLLSRSNTSECQYAGLVYLVTKVHCGW